LQKLKVDYNRYIQCNAPMQLRSSIRFSRSTCFIVDVRFDSCLWLSFCPKLEKCIRFL